MVPRRSVIVLCAVLLYLFIECFCYVSLTIVKNKFNFPYDPRITSLSDQQKTRLQSFLRRKRAQGVNQDPVLGWTNRFQENSAGMRDDREYPPVPAPDIIRLSAFGDSFTFGADVGLYQSWAKQLDAMNPQLEVLNYGVGAYGLDQAYLRYLQVGAEYAPKVILIGYMSENISRNVNVFRAFYTKSYRNVIFTKPRFTLRDDDLVLLENPVSTLEDHRRFLNNDVEELKRLGAHDYHYQINYDRGSLDFLPSVRFVKIFWHAYKKTLSNPIYHLDGSYNTDSEAYLVTMTILDEFYRKSLENGALPIILVFPDIVDQWRSRQEKPRRYQAFLETFRSKGYRFIDALEALEPYQKKYTVKQLTRNWGHYSPVGNEIVAEHIHEQLQSWDFTSLSTVKAAIVAEQQRLGIVIP